jgi:hypothetical protein
LEIFFNLQSDLMVINWKLRWVNKLDIR